jgi:hypothetical protein
MPAPDLYLRLKKKWSEHGRSLDVTLKTLTLGSADLTTGWYGKGYSDSTINMAIVFKGTQKHLLQPGIVMTQDAIGYTKDTVREGDQIVDQNSNTFTIVTVHDHNILDQFMFNECDLKLHPAAARGASSWSLWSGSNSPYHRLVRALEKNAAHSSTVTIYPLVLGGVDSETGWYAKSYGLGTQISCVILDKAASNTVLRPLGLYTEYTHAGFTQADLNEGDIIKDYVGVLHRVRNYTPRVVADQLVFLDLDLELMETFRFLDAALIPDFSMQLSSYALGDEYNPATINQGTITEDGTVYYLPGAHVDTKNAHAIEWNPPGVDWIFDHWEAGSNIVFDDDEANPTTAYIQSGQSGGIIAVFVELVYTIGLDVDPDDPCDVNRIVLAINGKVYNGPWPRTDTENPSVQDVLATFNINYDELDHWEATGGVSLADPNVNPCSVTITADGTLKCVSRGIAIVFESKHLTVGGDTNKGKIGYWMLGDWQWQFDPLPQTSSPWEKQTLAFKWDPKTSGKTFDHWETAGLVTVDNANSNPTNVTIAGSGTLRAVYTG